MKKATKISLISGLVMAGALLCGVHIANAQTNIDTGYTITIPSEVGIDKDSGKGSFSVSGKMDAQTELDVTTTSQNNYKLKCGSQFIDYTLDKQSFHIDNIKSANPKSFNEDFNITLANTNTSFSGSYEDKLVFDITGNKYVYKLDANSLLDGKVEFSGHDYGSFDVYINGQKVADDVSNFDKVYPYGTEYEFKDLKGTVGHHYSGVGTYGPHWKETPLKGKLGIDAMYYKTDDSPYLLATPCYFKFDTNKLTINYHADGAQSWKDSNTDNATEIDVSSKDIMDTEYLKYDELYDEDAGKQHFCSVARIKRNGYTAEANTWRVSQKGSLEVQDYKALQKAQDVAEYCGVLNEFKKNDTTIDLYPIWIPNTYTLTYDLNGGSFKSSTTQLFKYGSGDAISSETPVKAGYVFTGWRWNEVIMQPGDKIPLGWGNFTLTAQWKEVYSAGTTLNIEGTEYIVLEKRENNQYLVLTTRCVTTGGSVLGRYFQSSDRSDGQNKNTYEGSQIDNYLENNWYNSLSSTMKTAIQSVNIKQATYAIATDPDSKQETGYNSQVYNTIKRHAFLPSVSEIGKIVDLKSRDKVRAFLKTFSANFGIWTRDSYQGNADDAECLYAKKSFGSHSAPAGLKSTGTADSNLSFPAFVIDLSKIDYTVTGTVNYK